jgi:hypothetical protein
VRGVDGVFAAGDCTAFALKHPSIAAQQADAVAAAIVGEEQPFKPVLRCMLPSRLPWYVEAPLCGGQGDATAISPHPLWPGDTRFGAGHLAPWLAAVRNGLSGPAAVSRVAQRSGSPCVDLVGLDELQELLDLRELEGAVDAMRPAYQDEVDLGLRRRPVHLDDAVEPG